MTLSDTNLGVNEAAYDALDVDTLLSELYQFDAAAADIVSLRVFGGLSIEEAAEVLKLSVATVNRRWAAPAFLPAKHRLRRRHPPEPEVAAVTVAAAR